MKTALLLAALASALSLTGPARAQSAAEFAATTVSLSAVGQTTATPDRASLSLGVTAKAPTAAQALQQDSQAMTQVLAALRGLGVQDRDIRTSGLNVQGQYTFAPNQPQRLTGYQASNRLTVAVQDISRLGPLVDAAVAAGATEVSGINFALKDAKGAEDQARLEAIKAVAAKAELYAKAAGYRVARLVTLSEGEGASPRVRGVVEDVVVTGSRIASTPIAGGDIDVRVQVNAVYELMR